MIEDELIDTANLSQYFTISEISEGDNVYQRIAGQSFVYNNDIALSDLRYLKMLHVNFDGNYQVGEMIVNASVAQQVTEIFEQLCEARYEIYSMYLIDDFWVGNGTDSDTNSIDHNNTSCFCYRPATGGGNLSRHAMGLAIDLNPQQNPYVRINADGSLSRTELLICRTLSLSQTMLTSCLLREDGHGAAAGIIRKTINISNYESEKTQLIFMQSASQNLLTNSNNAFRIKCV